MANDVTINIKANTTQAQSSLKNFGKSLNTTVQGLTGMNLSALAGVGGVVMLGNAVKKSITQWQNYALAAKDASATIGMNVEDFSRLVQVADDVRLSQETLTSSLQLASKNGFLPSIENLAKLADELKGMDVLERNAKLSQIFGRSWKEVYKILADGGDALRNNTKLVADGMVVTQQAAIEANKLYKALDDLEDSWTALSNTGIKAVVPALAFQLKTWNELITMAQRGKNIFELMNYQQIQVELNTNANSRTARTYSERLTGLATSMGYVISENGELVLAIQEQGNAAANAAPSVRGLEQAYKDVYTAQDSLQQATADFGVEVGQNLQSSFEQAGVKGDELNSLLGIMDDSLGTNLLPTQQLKDMQNELVTAYLNGGRDGEAFKKKLEEMKGPMEDLYQPIVDARVALQDMRAELQLLTSKVWNITIAMGAPTAGLPNPGGSSVPSNPLNTSGITAGKGAGKAFGGPVMGGQSYIVGERGPELFTPYQSGSITPNNQLNMGGITINVSGAGNPTATANAIALRLARYGKQYQGR